MTTNYDNFIEEKQKQENRTIQIMQSNVEVGK